MGEKSLMEIPRCPVHGEQLMYRPSKTAVEKFCGTWYKCPVCEYTTLFRSAELDGMYRSAGKLV